MTTAAFREALYGADLNDAIVALLTIAHADFPVLRLARNTEDVVSRGETYSGCAFRGTLPEDDGETLPTVKVTVDHVDQALTDALRSVAEGAEMTLELVLASAPDVVESGPYFFRVTSAMWNWQELSLTLGYEDLLNLPYPADSLDPQVAPGLFK
jgi:hypothetical protein